ncbi:MAG: MarR family transcriptional regulator, partial [Firmicutes bacterium]|nr:MarR family transcriptional regulator [Bacillota bacterium]
SALHKMQSKGLLELKSGEGRNVKVFLTSTGEELMSKTAKCIIYKESEIFDSWTKRECETFIALSQKYLDGLKKKVSEL